MKQEIVITEVIIENMVAYTTPDGLISIEVRLKRRNSISPERLLIYISPLIAEDIRSAWQGEKNFRPLSSDLTVTIIKEHTALDPVRAVITKLENSIFYAIIQAQKGEEKVEIDCRPSDAISQALRLGIPIFANEALLTEMEGEEEIVVPVMVTPEKDNIH